MRLRQDKTTPDRSRVGDFLLLASVILGAALLTTLPYPAAAQDSK